MMHNKVHAKKTDPGSFTIPCSIGNNYTCKALCDPGASINLMPKYVFQKLGVREAKPTTVMLQLADRSPFLATSRTKIDFEKGELDLHVDREQVKIKVFKVQGQQNNEEDNNAITEPREKRTQTSKPYLGAHTERDKGVVTLKDV
ncbi:hypothetical protein V6N11_058344 [Hibiscus sabdariffa]|uniref:Uncharacterized protein n=1 Tax=Hibiscus sabdariffa TaxID=183260 RepID=A0ABR2U494_9ROSI